VVDRYGGISKEFIGVIIKKKKYNRIGLISACRVDTYVLKIHLNTRFKYKF
jgi:hypothetical protein